MRKLLLMVALLCALGALSGQFVQGTARAAGLTPAVADCDSNGRLTKHYSAAELRQALATMPADVAEYTNCPDVIRRALLSEVAIHGDAPGGGGGSFLPGWVIAVLVVVVLIGAGAGVVAVRNRRREDPNS